MTGGSPVSVQNLAGVLIYRVHNDASVSPALLELVLVLGVFRIKGLVEESPGQLFLPVNLQSPACSHADELPPKVGVFFITVVQSDRTIRHESEFCHIIFRLKN